MATTKAANPVITKPLVAATELYRVLHDAKLFASKDDSLPMLHGIHLRATGELLIASATDRFTLGISKAQYMGPAFEVLMPMPEVELVMRTLRPPRGPWRNRMALIHVTPSGSTLRVTVNGIQISVPVRPGEDFPPTAQLFPKEGTKLLEVPAVLGYNPDYLGRFGKVTGARQASYYIQSPSKPMVVNVGEDFVGLIMPIRLAGTDQPTTYNRPTWLP